MKLIFKHKCSFVTQKNVHVYALLSKVRFSAMTTIWVKGIRQGNVYPKLNPKKEMKHFAYDFHV